MDYNKVTILLVEDDDIDAEGIQRAFKKHRIANQIVRASNGIEALMCLRGSVLNNKVKVCPPYIILLDINMPRMNGHEFLQELRNDEYLHGCVVFVLTTSADDQDIDQAYAQNVAGYIVKSRAGSDFTNLVGLMDHYWRYVELPRINS